MYTVELACDANHLFEGWYDSSADYEERLNRGELSCPVCDSEFVMRQSSTQSLAGKAVMNLVRRIKADELVSDDQVGSQFFKLLLD